MVYGPKGPLLYRYITQGRVESERPHLSPKRVARLLLTRPAALSNSQQELLGDLTAACPEMTSLARLVSSFAALLQPDPRNETRFRDWVKAARACDLPVIHAFTRGLDLDPQAVTAAVTLPFHNGRTEGVNTRTKMIKRQMYGRAGFALFRHRILLTRHHGPSPPKVRQSRKCDRAGRFTVPKRRLNGAPRLPTTMVAVVGLRRLLAYYGECSGRKSRTVFGRDGVSG